MVDLIQVVKWVVLVGVIVAAVIGLASLAGTIAGTGTESVTHFFNSYQGHTDVEVPGDGNSVMSPQEWAAAFVLSQFGGIWSAAFTVVAAFITAFVGFVIVRYLIRALT